jgi:hypothetical protein
MTMINFHSLGEEFGPYFVSTKMSEEVTDYLASDAESITSSHLDRGAIGEGSLSRDTRWVKAGLLPLSFWGSLILGQAAREANDRHFHFDITGWADYLQFLLYEKGDHYKAWHQDSSQSIFNEEEVRKLTVLMGLSSPSSYEGGEFSLYVGKFSQTFKLEKGQICVFPSAIHHRVRKVTSGVRKTIVGWYGGPPFK